PHGMGLAPTPSRDSAGCRTLPALRKGGLTLDALAALARSWDPFETALGMAAINACCNRYDLQGEAGNGLDSLAGGDGRVVVIGGFPGIERHLPGCHVIEREPAAGQYPETAAEWLLADAEAVVATASTLANRSLPRLLQQARGARFALVGPSATLSPRLFSYGIEALSGLVVTDPEGMAQAVATGAGARDVKAFGRAVTLRP
ncbi:MAG: hypothetical protein K2Q10_06290, partial [Rhodospirillales bacterium]|nr:hypothetical protein [Rhodospirillales bacterium]